MKSRLSNGFEGDRGGNENYPEGNLENLIIKVERGEGLESGDTVTVKVPANLLPLRKFDLTTTEDESETTLDITPVNPIRIFYGVSLKDGVVEAEESGELPALFGDSMADYIASHTTKDGKVFFLSNKWSAEDADAKGTTTAVFEPNDENKTFYYYAEDTAIYTDKEPYEARQP